MTEALMNRWALSNWVLFFLKEAPPRSSTALEICPKNDRSCQKSTPMTSSASSKENLTLFWAEEWVTDTPFVISPRITIEVSVRLLDGLMALGYTIEAILKRRSHVYCDEKVCVKIDWLKELNRHYVQVLTYTSNCSGCYNVYDDIF